MSRRAKEVLKDLLAPYVEFFPLKGSFGEEYFGINVLEEVDALDEEASEITRFPNGRVMVIHNYVFKPEAVAGKVIFRIPRFPLDIFVTEIFADKVREYGLTGLELIDLWNATNSSNGKNDGKHRLIASQIPLNGRLFKEQLEERLKELISEKTGFRKESVEMTGDDVKFNFEHDHIKAYFLANNEKYFFLHSEPWEVGDLIKVVKTGNREDSKGE